MDDDDFEGFLRWHCGPLLDSRNRNAYALWLVQRAVGHAPDPYRPEGSAVATLGDGLSLAVHSAAHLQPERQTSAAINFGIGPRAATLHVFCLLTERNPEVVNPRARDQWRFWVVPTARLHAERRSIGLQALIRAHGEGLGYSQLAERIAEIRASFSLGA